MSIKFVQLGEVTTLQAGIGFPLNLQGRKNGLFPFAKVGDISRCGRTGNSVLATADHYVDQADIDSLRAKPVPVGSVLFAKIGEAIRQNHRVVAGCRMLIDNNAMAAIPGERIDGRFLYHFLKTVDFYCLAPATTVPALRKSDLERLPIPLPPIPDQRRIAAILDQADALRAKRREALAQLDSLTQSIFMEMFGGNRIAETQISELLKAKVLLLHKDGNHGSLYPRADDFGDSGVPFLSAKCINELGEIDGNRIEYLKTEVALKLKIGWIESGDVLLSHNASVGKVALYDGRFGKALIGTSLTAFRPNPIYLDSLFLAASLQGSGFQGQLMSNMGQTTRNQVPITAQRELALVIPPIGSQRKFSEKVSSIWKQRHLHRIATAELDTLFSSLQHRAFRGEL